MVGQIISHYRIIKKLGEGGMGEVYLADDLHLKRHAALKFLPNYNNIHEEEKIRFVNEAQSTAALNHPSICTVYEFDEADGRPFIAMEYIKGETLQERIYRSRISIEECIRIILDISNGLREASRKKIVHRDIKSGNILLSENGGAKVTDFGLAKLSTLNQITKLGSTIGTVSYMSPEQVNGDEIDSRSDIWSLGVLFYEMLTNSFPFRGESDQAVIYSILNEDPIPIDESEIVVPKGLNQIIKKMLRKKLSDRYQNFEEIIDDLEDFCEKANIIQSAIYQRAPFKKVKSSFFNYGIVFVLFVIISAIYFTFWTGEAKNNDIKLLIFPFECIGNEDDNLLTQGMYADLVTRLSNINGLNVVSSKLAQDYDTSSNKFKLLKENKVDFWIEGNVQLTNFENQKNIKVNINLINSEEVLIWSDQLLMKMEDVFDIYSKIAENVARNLDIKILEPEREKIADRPTENSEAYQLMLKVSTITREAQTYQSREERIKGENDAIELLEKVVDLDSSYYRPLWLLSFKHSYMYYFGFDKTIERKTQVINAYLKIKTHFPNLSSTKFLEATHVYRIEGNYKKCYELLKEIRKTSPNSGFLWLGIVERRLGLWNNAQNNIIEHIKLYPEDGDGPVILGHIYTMTRNYKLADIEYDISLNNQKGFIDAIREKSRNYILWNGDIQSAKNLWNSIDVTLSREKDYFWIFLLRMNRDFQNLLALINSYKDDFVETQTNCFVKPTEIAKAFYLMKEFEKGKYFADSAAQILQDAIVNNPTNPVLHSTLGITYALSGNKEKALEHSERAVSLCPVSYDAIDGPIYLLNQAETYSILGMKNKAISNLAYLLTIPCEVSVAYLKTDPLWDCLRGEDQFKSLVSN